MLTEQEIARFWEDGFVTVEDVFTSADVNSFREATECTAIQRDLEKRHADERVVHLIPITTRHDAFKRLARDRRIVERIAKLIGDDVQLSNSKLATKPRKKGAGAFDWHQDFAYYAHTNYDLVTASVMLDDATAENGGMYAVKGSHRLGLLDHTRDGWMIGACVEPKYWEKTPNKVAPLMTRSGGIAIHHCLTLHGSPPNYSGESRRMIVFQFRAGHCYQLSDHTWEDTGFQACGTPCHRVKLVDMDIPLPRNRGWEIHSGEVHGSVYRQIGTVAREWNRETAGILTGGSECGGPRTTRR
jgi:ectoine hydroxylase-related dioxygenase (phytanoyl-CoA dioxygenase family)